MWTHKKQGKKEFKGTYEQIAITHSGKRERIFILKTWNKDGTLKRAISFESWQAAKKLGWVKA